jgi:CBS domain-containing protein
VRARDLTTRYETVGIDSEATGAARLMAEHRLPALLVVDEQGAPAAILPASQMVKVLVPDYVTEDPALASVVDESHADRLCQVLSGRTVRECLTEAMPAPPLASPDDTMLEVAALMAQVRSPLVAVVDGADEPDGGRESPASPGPGGSRESGASTESGERPPGGRLLGVITASHLLKRLLEAAP